MTPDRIPKEKQPNNHLLTADLEFQTRPPAGGEPLSNIRVIFYPGSLARCVSRARGARPEVIDYRMHAYAADSTR